MNSLMIKDLAVTEELDSRAMSAVRGGTFYFPGYSVSKTDFTFNTQQLIGQTQNVVNENGNNVAEQSSPPWFAKWEVFSSPGLGYRAGLTGRAYERLHIQQRAQSLRATAHQRPRMILAIQRRLDCKTQLDERERTGGAPGGHDEDAPHRVLQMCVH